MGNNDLLQGRPKWIILEGGNPYVINVEHPDMLRIMGAIEDISNEVDTLQIVVNDLTDQVVELNTHQQQMFLDIISLTSRVNNLEATMSGSILAGIHNTQIVYNPDKTIQKIYYRNSLNVLLRYSYDFVYSNFKAIEYKLEVYDNGALLKKYLVTISYNVDGEIVTENISEVV